MSIPTALPPSPIAATAESLPSTLPDLLDGIWRRIEGACGSLRPWSLPVLATATAHAAPSLRVLVLRHADRASRTFSFQVDARSRKVREIADNGAAALLFFDPSDAVQVRFEGIARVHVEDDVARRAWGTASPLRRVGSALEQPPGAPLPGPARFDRLPAPLDEAAALRNFAVVEFAASSLDWLWLGPQDLRSASFRWTGDAEAVSCWTVP